LERLASIGALPSNPTLRVARAAYFEAIRAFNRHDFRTAFALLSPECEFQTVEQFEARTLVGAKQVIRFFNEEALDLFPNWNVQTIRFLQAAPGVFVTLDRGRGSGRESGTPVVLDLSSVLQIRRWRVVRVDQHPTWEEGLNAVGLDPAMAGEVRRSARQATR
jgi:hypothetical protein